VRVPTEATSNFHRPPIVSEKAPDFVQKVTAVMLANKGDLLPVSAFPPDGTWPSGTTKWEKRNIAMEIPLWDEDVCIQCNQCALVCPRAAIRAKVYQPDALEGAPESFLSKDYKAPDFKGLKYTIQVAPEDCTGCSLCVEVCPAKNKENPRRKAINMELQRPVRDRERENYEYFLGLPEVDRSEIHRFDAKGSQWLEPLFEYSGACAGCGETPYVKLLSQLFGDRLLVAGLLEADQYSEAGIAEQRERVDILRGKLEALGSDDARHLDAVADYLVKKSVWLVGGDGWAYDIGYGGLDHVLSTDRDVNILVLDTEVYSNTGGQASKATPIGAAAKFASAGKSQPKKPLGLEAITFRTVYVARIAFGANMNQTVQALREAEAYPGPSLVVAYSPCIAHGYDLSTQVEQQKRLVKSGGWALYRYDPRRVLEGEPPLQMDSRRPTGKVNDYMKLEARFRMVEKMDPVRYKGLLELAQDNAEKRWAVYEHLAGLTLPQYETPEELEETEETPS